jgi:hypothetical protein
MVIFKQVGGYEKNNIRRFDKGQAVDVVRAVYNTYVSPDTTSTGLTPVCHHKASALHIISTDTFSES